MFAILTRLLPDEILVLREIRGLRLYIFYLFFKEALVWPIYLFKNEGAVFVRLAVNKSIDETNSFEI